MTATGDAPGVQIVLAAQKTPARWSDSEPLERVARDVLRAHRFFLAARLGKPDGSNHLCAHGEEVGGAAGGVTKPDEERIAERIGLGPLRSVRADSQVDQLLRLAYGQRPQNQRVHQRECGYACPERERQRRHRSCRDRCVLPQHPQTEPNVAKDRLEPREQLDVAALLPPAQRVAEAAGDLRGGRLARHSRGQQLADTFLEVELELLVQLTLDPPRTKYVPQPRPQRHRPPSLPCRSLRRLYASFKTLTTAAVTALQCSSSDSSCRLPAAVIS